MPAAPPERRHVAILFADLSGFTRLSERMDPEDVRDLVDELFGRFRVLIEKRGGTVDKFIGDAVMAVFGAPVAHADDASRAVAAGLALQESLAAFSREKNIALAMRVGVNSGEILWGSVGGAAPTAMGDPVNVAQRLESAAQPGTVLASRAVERACRASWRFVPAGTVSLKGRDETVETFVAQEVPAEVTELRAAAPSPFSGRDGDLLRLLDLWRGGKGGGVMLVGEAGLGKSRMAAELRRRVRTGETKTRVLLGRCRETAAAPLEAIADLLRAEGSDPAAIRLAIAARLQESEPDQGARERFADVLLMSAGLAAPGSPLRSLDPAQLALESRRAWTVYVASLAPVLICIEDLHWSDPATSSLLALLAAASAGRRSLIVATSRTRESLPGGFAPFALTGVDAAAAGSIAARALGEAPSPELATWLQETSGGNPLYVEELARFLATEGALEGHPPRLRAQPGKLPGTLVGLLTARLDALPPGPKEALKAASVLGRQFWPGVVAEMGATAAALEAAEGEGLIAARGTSQIPGEAEMSFRHALIRDAAYGLLPKKERTRLHAVAADRIQSRLPGGGRVVRSLAAHQWREAGDASGAAVLWQDAAAEALAESCWEESLDHARRADGAAPSGASALGIARAMTSLGRYEEARALASEAASRGASRWDVLLLKSNLDFRQGLSLKALEAIDEALADPPSPGEALEARVKRARILELLGRRTEALDCAQLAAAEADGALKAEALALAARAAHALGQHHPSQDLILQSIALLRTLTDPEGLAGALNLLGRFLVNYQRIPEARVALEESLEIRRRIADPIGIASTLVTLADCYREHEIDRCRALCEEALTISRSLGDPIGMAWAIHRLSWLESDQGRLSSALDLSRQACGIFREAAVPHGVSNTLASSAFLLMRLDRAAEALPLIEESLAIDQKIGHRWNQIMGLHMLGSCHRVLENAGAAEKAFREAAALAQAPSLAELLHTSLFRLATLQLDTDPHAVAGTLAQLPILTRAQAAEDVALKCFVTALMEIRRGDAAAASRLLAEGRAAGRTVVNKGEKLDMAWHESWLLREMGDAAAAREIATTALEDARRSEAPFWIRRFREVIEGTSR